MYSNKRTARIVGVLYIIGTVAGVLGVVLTKPILSVPDYFMNVSANENQIVLGALCILIMALALAMVPVMMFPISRRYNETLALGYVVFRGTLETVTYFATVISLLLLITLSQLTSPGAALDVSGFQVLVSLLLESGVISSMTTAVFILGALMFYYVLYQARLIPRWLSGWGLIATLPYLAAGLLLMFGLTSHMSTIDAVLRLPLGIQEMVLAGWLIVKGFNPSALTSESG